MMPSKPGMVLQGYFLIERLPRTQRVPAVAQLSRHDWAASAPRPDLMPAPARGPVVQASRSGPGASRLAPLPGMALPRVASVVQTRTRDGIVTAPLAGDRLRLIGPGRPMEPGIRRIMESMFQADFSTVQVHEGPLAEAMGALAFTVGDTLYFAPGRYAPHTRDGVELLGHELTHVVQQREGRVTNPYGCGVAIVQDPELEAEADAQGSRIADAICTSAGVRQPALDRGAGQFALQMRRRRVHNVVPVQRPTRRIPITYEGTQDWLAQMPLNRRYNLEKDDLDWMAIAYGEGLPCPVLGHGSTNSKGSVKKANTEKSKFVTFMKGYCQIHYGVNKLSRAKSVATSRTLPA